jgi:hypothetical protein
MTEQTTLALPTAPARAPDPILAELWEVKRQLNAEAGYDVDVLARMAHEAAERVNAELSRIHRQ